MMTTNSMCRKLCDSLNKLCDSLNKLRDFLIRIYSYIIYIIILASFVIFSLLGFEIGKSAYFYTLSTISQTLAALIGIVAIFVIFKLDMLETKRSYSVKCLKDLLQSPVAMGLCKYHDQESYKLISSIMTEYYSNPAIDDVFLDRFSPAMAELKSDNSQIDQLNKNCKNPIDDINKIDEQIKNILSKFSHLAIVVLSAIVLSILALPFGWSTIPASALLDLSIPKMPLVGFIVFLAVLSIFQTARFIDDVITRKY